MITKNCKKFMKLGMMAQAYKSATSSGVSLNSTFNETVKDTSGTDHTITGGRGMFSSTSSNESFFGATCRFSRHMTSISTSSSGIALGSGSTPATENDYTIESIISNLTAVLSVINVYQNANGDYCFDLVYNVTNSTDGDITVREACLFAGGTANNITNKMYGTFLLDRTVLDTPLVVPANSMRTLQYTITVDWTI